MREIKFKAKRVSDGEWVEGSLIQDYIHHQPNSTITQGGCIYNEVTPESVCQFTGLVDRNGKEVYEGDIVVIDWYNHNSPNRKSKQYVSFDKGCFFVCDCLYTELDIDDFDLFRSYAGLYNFFNPTPNTIEVIGNIHDKIGER